MSHLVYQFLSRTESVALIHPLGDELTVMYIFLNHIRADTCIECRQHRQGDCLVFPYRPDDIPFLESRFEIHNELFLKVNAALHRLGGVVLPLFATLKDKSAHVPLRPPVFNKVITNKIGSLSPDDLSEGLLMIAGVGESNPRRMIDYT